jgi:hypothetical protein
MTGSLKDLGLLTAIMAPEREKGESMPSFRARLEAFKGNLEIPKAVIDPDLLAQERGDQVKAEVFQAQPAHVILTGFLVDVRANREEGTTDFSMNKIIGTNLAGLQSFIRERRVVRLVVGGEWGGKP